MPMRMSRRRRHRNIDEDCRCYAITAIESMENWICVSKLSTKTLWIIKIKLKTEQKMAIKSKNIGNNMKRPLCARALATHSQ